MVPQQPQNIINAPNKVKVVPEHDHNSKDMGSFFWVFQQGTVKWVLIKSEL